MVQALSPPKRYRGFVLTSIGLQKLQGGIQRLQTQTRVRQNPKTIAEQVQLIKANGIHPTTVRKMLRCQQGVDKRSIADVFEALQLTLSPGDYAHTSLSAEKLIHRDIEYSKDSHLHKSVDESVSKVDFYGRTAEMAELNRKILVARCRLVAVLGVEGIGKTALLHHFMAEQNEFECCVWKSLHPAMAVSDLIASMLQSLGQPIQPPETVETLTTRLLEQLKCRRCLLILDGVETILENRSLAGYYRDGYEDYSDFFRAIAEHPHLSCLVFTSQETPRDFKRVEGELVQALHLQGLNPTESQQLLQMQGVVCRLQADMSYITTYYAGNPLILKWLATRVWDYFDGNLSNYLGKQSYKQLLFQDVWDLLNTQFNRVSDLEQQVMTQLAISDDWVVFATLQSKLVSVISQQDLLDVIESLHRRSMLQKRGAHFKLLPAMAEFFRMYRIEATQTNRSTLLQRWGQATAALA